MLDHRIRDERVEEFARLLRETHSDISIGGEQKIYREADAKSTWENLANGCYSEVNERD